MQSKTHDQGEALTMSDRIAVMNDGEVPISYLPGTPTRLRVKTVGDLPHATATTS